MHKNITRSSEWSKDKMLHNLTNACSQHSSSRLKITQPHTHIHTHTSTCIHKCPTSATQSTIVDSKIHTKIFKQCFPRWSAEYQYCFPKGKKQTKVLNGLTQILGNNLKRHSKAFTTTNKKIVNLIFKMTNIVYHLNLKHMTYLCHVLPHVYIVSSLQGNEINKINQTGIKIVTHPFIFNHIMHIIHMQCPNSFRINSTYFTEHLLSHTIHIVSA